MIKESIFPPCHFIIVLIFSLFDMNDSERTRVLLTGAAYVHLKHLEVSKYTRNLSPASRAILLSGPAGKLSVLLLSPIHCVFSPISVA